MSLLALSTVQGYHGYVLFVWLYGVCLGGFLYSLKMFTMERVRARYFTRTWGFVQGAEAIPVLLGVPITGLCCCSNVTTFIVQEQSMSCWFVIAYEPLNEPNYHYATPL